MKHIIQSTFIQQQSDIFLSLTKYTVPTLNKKLTLLISDISAAASIIAVKYRRCSSRLLKLYLSKKNNKKNSAAHFILLHTTRLLVRSTTKPAVYTTNSPKA